MTLRKIKEITDTDSHMMWIDPQVINADKPTYLLVQMLYTDYWCSDAPETYYMTVYAVGPKWLSKKKLESVAESLSMTLKEFKALSVETQCEILVDNGTAATLWQKAGNNKDKLLKAAREELTVIQIMFGWYMDRHQNQIGDTGWDWISGNIGAAMERRRKEPITMAEMLKTAK